LFNSYFLVRRLFYAAVLLFLHDQPILQATALTCTSIWMMCCLLTFQPYSSEVMNKMEFINEVFVLVLSYAVYLFSDLVPDVRLRAQIGYYYCYTIMLNLLVNVAVILKLMIFDSCKRAYNKRKFR